jgi:D-alanyl-lipoteichoic acid acyltransferase DltB (MBOAT superfamily)
VIRYLAYVAFFPQLVAGPIERATRLLPQFRETRVITRPQVEEGTWLILWGLFKKVVLADNLAPLVDLVYGDGQSAGPAVIAATIAFGLQIYCDFSGYTDIARGLAKVLGFELTLNFNLPYAASSLRDFWRRWHISLSTWLRDYLYVSLGGNRRGEARTLMNLAITMLLGGLWHGAAANFLLWGAWHGFGLIVNRAWERWRRPVWALPAPLAWVLTMAFVFYGWLLFRSSSAESLYQLTSALGTWTIPRWFGRYLLNLLVLGMPLMAMQLWQWRRQNLMVALTLPGWSRALLQGALLWGVLLYWSKDAPTPFIYFQF